MTQMYEAMFLLDNQVVREDWKKAKSVVTETLGKHGAKVLAARRWDERKLAYPIRRRRRGTYCLTFYEMPNEGIAALRRDLDLSETVLRYLILSREELPEGEVALASAEDEAGFSAPTPPPDDAPDSGSGGRRREEGAEGDAEVAAEPLAAEMAAGEGADLRESFASGSSPSGSRSGPTAPETEE